MKVKVLFVKGVPVGEGRFRREREFEFRGRHFWRGLI
jgi:hypothetical protein